MGRDWGGAPQFRRCVSAFVSSALRLIWGLEVEGLEYVPEEGPLIVASNHAAIVDGAIAAVSVAPKRYWLPLTKQEAYRLPVIGWFLRRVGTIPIDRRGDVQALRAALDVLQSGGCLGIFPEGTRSKTGLPGKPKAGVGFLASRSGAPVTPARIFETRRFPLTRSLRVRFGPPMRLDDRDADHAACQAFAESVMERVFSL